MKEVVDVLLAHCQCECTLQLFTLSEIKKVVGVLQAHCQYECILLLFTFSEMKEVVEVLRARGANDKLAQEFWKDYKKHLHLKDRFTAGDGEKE